MYMSASIDGDFEGALENGETKVDKKLSKKFKFLGELCAHSLSSNENDHTGVWSCAFEPEYEGCYPNLAATCGGNTICFVDCSTMSIVKKYRHFEDETFITLAWTVLSNESGQIDDMNNSSTFKPFSILATGSSRGDIKLIEPSILSCYACLHAHRSRVNALRFSITNPNWLLSAGNDKYILLWKISSPQGDDSKTSNECICRFDQMQSPPISLDFNEDGTGFLAGCDDSDCKYFQIPQDVLSSSKKKIDCMISFYGYEDNYHGSNIDCLHVVRNNIVGTLITMIFPTASEFK
jgi:WD40 repeat protein